MLHPPQLQELVLAASGLTVGAVFRAQVLASPERIALEQDGRTRSYAELNDRVNRLVQVLAARGVTRGDRVAMLSENRMEYVELEMAVAKLGAIVGCQNWRLADAELTHCLRLIEPKLIIYSERLAATISRLDHGVSQVMMLGDECERALAHADTREPPDLCDPEDGLTIIYTSGTTGLPKAAVISQRAMIARAISNRIDHPCDRDDNFIAWSPMFHVSATDHIFAALMRGAKAILMDGFDAETFVRIAAREKIAHLTVLPGVVDKVIDELKRSGLRPKGARAVGVVADLVPRDKIAELTTLVQAPYCNSFGATETGWAPASKGRIPIGVVPERLSKEQSSFCALRLVDPDDRDVPDGEPGEVACRSPSVFSGYWAAPEVNAHDFRGGWFHMGDVFVRNPDRTLDFVDRRKYLIKSGGENIYPAEIERVLLASPRVGDAIVVRCPDPKWGEVPVAFVVRRDETLTKDDVIGLCRGRIANYKLPKEVRFVKEAELERSASGKIMRQSLEALLKRDLAGATTNADSPAR